MTKDESLKRAEDAVRSVDSGVGYHGRLWGTVADLMMDAYAKGIEAGRDLQAREDAAAVCRYCNANLPISEDRQFHEDDFGPTYICEARFIRRARPGAFTEGK